MSVPSRHILEQGHTLSALGRAVWTSVERPFKSQHAKPFELGAARIEARLAPRRPDLVRDYVRHLHGDPAAYGNTLPAHLFPQWAFGLGGRALGQTNLPLTRIINLGGGFTVHRPLPADEPLCASCSVVDVDDDGSRAIVTARVITGTPSAPAALSADIVSLFPLGKRGAKGGKRAKAQDVTLPARAQKVASLSFARTAGLDFAKLTGDFNPIHWLPPIARAAGFAGIVLQGNATIAHTLEALNRTVFDGDVHRLQSWRCKLTHPVVLPASCSVWVDGCDVYVLTERERQVVLTGTFATATEGRVEGAS